MQPCLLLTCLMRGSNLAGSSVKAAKFTDQAGMPAQCRQAVERIGVKQKREDKKRKSMLLGVGMGASVLSHQSVWLTVPENTV